MPNDGSNPVRKGDDLAHRLLVFAGQVGAIVELLPESRLGRHIAAQLIRSGTSPAPNYAEARAAESSRDFTHKLSIALKELRESEVWLQMIVHSRLLPETSIDPALDECQQLIRIFAKSIVTSKSKRSL